MTDIQEHKNVVSFSIVDADQEKLNIALENAKVVSTLFPDWEAHFYVPTDLDSAIKDQISSEKNCSVFLIEQSADSTRDTWMFMPLGQPNTIANFIARSSDQLLTESDVELVNSWMDSPYQFIMKNDEDGLNLNSFGAKLHGPINTIWMIHYLHTKSDTGVVDVENLMDRFYRAFTFLFQPIE